MQELLFATHNRHKADEIEKLLAGAYRLLTLDEAGFSEEIVEDALTLEGNALLKARFLFSKTGKPCFADDTGLEVVALGGAPGVHTARYAGEECNPDKNMDKLLDALKNADERGARFRTVVAYIDASGKEHLFEGVCEGEIALSRHGGQGFGYDPVFAPKGFGGHTFAEMSMEDKNKISHRGRAVRLFVEYLKSLK